MRARVRRRPPNPDEGSAVVEMVILTPILVIVLLTMIAVGRLVSARQTVDDAAKQAARAATLASSTANTTADAALRSAGLACTSSSVSLNSSADQPGGSVTVTVTCTVSLSQLSLVPIGGHTTISSTFTEPVDTYIDETGGG